MSTHELYTTGNLHQFLGMRFVQAAMYPKYELPKEIIPGVPWPPGFREEINAWSKEFLGQTCLVPTGIAYVINGDTVIVHPEDYKRAIKIVNLRT